MDSAQVILIIVIILLTVILVALGVQVFFILREFKKTVSKANKVLDNTNVITQSVSSPISSLAQIASGMKTGATFINIFKKIISKEESSGKKNRED